ncbi:MAG: PEFG-CTERM sorting domain-containing protein [Nitrosotalea sp.]
MRKIILLLIFAISAIFITYQQADAITITATPQTPVFGPNDPIIVNLKIQGYNGGPIAWVAHRPDNSTISGNLAQVKGDGSAVHQIIRNAFDNYFGNWSIDYTYDGVNQTASFKVNPIVLTVFTDKDLYYEPDMMKINITTSYYIPIAAQAEFFHLNFYDQKGNILKDIPQIDIRASQHSTIYNFHMTELADYGHPPGLYKLRIQYYNTVVQVPFLLGKYSDLMKVSTKTDKSTYQVDDVVNMELLFTRVTQSNGTLTITGPSGSVTTHQFRVYSVHTPLVLNGITKDIGTYNYVVQYGGVSQPGSFNVTANPAPLPNIKLDVFLDKLNYRPGEIIHVKIHTSQVIINSTSLWVVDPNSVEYPRLSLPITAVDTILPHKIGKNDISGKWELYIDYDGIVRSIPYFVGGHPVDDIEMLNTNQFSVPTFVSNFATNFTAPTGIAIDSSGDIYVVDSGNSQVKKFDSNGKLLLSWGNPGSGNGQLLHPNGIFVGKKYVFVADTGNARIDIFNKDNGEFIYSFGGYGNSKGMFHTPVGLAADSQENILVADSGRNTIQEFNTDFTFMSEFKSLLTDNGNFTATSGIAVDSKGNIYVSSPDNKILEFSSIGNFVNSFGSQGSEVGRFNNPTAIAIDSNGNFYVADTWNHRVQKFDPYGNFVLSWGSAGTSVGQFEEPVGLAIDQSDNIYVVDKKNNNIQKFSLYGIASQTIPSWVRDRALLWSEGALDKRDFALAVRYLTNHGVPNTNQINETVVKIPDWMKKETNWWVLGQIDDETFISSLKYLLSSVITIPVDGTNMSVTHSITNGKVLDIKADTNSKSLIVSIQTNGNDTLTINMPRALIDAKKIDGNDNQFFVLNDGQENDQFQETSNTSTARTLKIPFTDGTSQIQISGTIVIPEFGPIAAMVLAIAIVSIIVISTKTGLRFTPRV